MLVYSEPVFVANSVDPDQNALIGAVWSRSTMFAFFSEKSHWHYIYMLQRTPVDVILDALYVDIVPYMFC